MDNEPRITNQPSVGITETAVRSTTGASYPGYPRAGSIPSHTVRYEWLKDTHGRKRFNACSHYLKWSVLDRALIEGSDSWYQTGSPSQGYWDCGGITVPSCWEGSRYGSVGLYGMSGEFGSWNEPIAGLPSLYENTFAGGRKIILPDGAYTKRMVDRSLRAMLPGIKSDASILNSLYELKDIKTLARTVDRLKEALAAVDRLKELYNLSKQAVQLLSGKKRTSLAGASARSILKSGADGYLQAQFNILPLLKDITVVKSVLSSARSQLSRLIADAGRLKVAHYRASVSDQYLPGTKSKTVSLPTFMVNTTHTGRRTVSYPTCMFYATMEYSYRIRGFSSFEDYLPRAVNDVLGIQLNPAIIWNALPWSFVVDWVFGVSRWLDQFAIRNIEPVTSISRYCYSYHIVREIQLSHGEGGNVVPFTRFGEEAYLRTPHVPDLYYSIESSGLNPKEFSLAGALALSR